MMMFGQAFEGRFQIEESDDPTVRRADLSAYLFQRGPASIQHLQQLRVLAGKKFLRTSGNAPSPAIDRHEIFLLEFDMCPEGFLVGIEPTRGQRQIPPEQRLLVPEKQLVQLLVQDFQLRETHRSHPKSKGVPLTMT